MITLVPMTDEDYAMFIRKTIPEYAIDQSRVGNWPASDAVALARSEYQQMLPDGTQTQNAYMRTIQDETGKKVGMLWFFIDPGRPKPTAFLIDFFMFPDGRRKGYESQALSLFEEEARTLGAHRVELQVFAHKNEEIALYHENGFSSTSILLAKDLPAQENV